MTEVAETEEDEGEKEEGVRDLHINGVENCEFR